MQTEEVHQQKGHHLGSFLALLVQDTPHCQPVNKSTMLKIRPISNLILSEHIRSFKQKTLRLAAVSKGFVNKKANFMDTVTKSGESYTRHRVLHGYLLHCFDEIWSFLLHQAYVKMEATLYTTFSREKEIFPDEGKTYFVVEVRVRLTEHGMCDPYELKILNYARAQRNKKDRITSRQEQQEERKRELIRFARLSLLLSLDLLCIYRPIPSLVKSDKQFKIFFTNIARIHRLDISAYRHNFLAFKDCLKLIVEDQIYFQQYLSENSSMNKLYERSEIEQLVLFRQKKGLVDQFENPFAFQFGRDIIYRQLYFNRFIRDYINFFRKLIKRSSGNVLKAKRQAYEEFCYKIAFRRIEMIGSYQRFKLMAQEYLTDEMYIGQLYNFITNFRSMSSYTNNMFVVFHQKDRPFRAQIHPFADVINSLNEYIQNVQGYKDGSGRENENQNMKQEYKMIKESRDIAIKTALNYQYNRQDLQADQDINNFLNSRHNELILEHQSPQTLKCELKKYQKQALQWMLYREQKVDQYYVGQQNQSDARKLSPLWEQVQLQDGAQFYVNSFTGKISQSFQPAKPTQGGILADEMGLGKTIMALALIHQTKSPGKQTLIVVPKSVLTQWESEIKQHSLLNSISVLCYYKKPDRRNKIKFEDFDVVLTTYNVLGMDYQDWVSQQEEIKSAPNELIAAEQQAISARNKNTMIQEEQKEKSYGSNKQKIKKKPNLGRFPNNFQMSSSSDSSDISVSGDDRLSPPLGLNDYSQSSDEEPFHPFLYQRQTQLRKKQSAISEQLKDSRQKKRSSKKATKNQRTKKPRDHDLLNLFDFSFYRVILDEAHNIKNRTSIQTKGALALKAEYRWCLTGTPMQNKHDDLFSLVSFLQVETFGEYFWWNTYINKEENEDDQQQILNQILQPILLRRVKNSQTTNLEQINEDIVWVQLSEEEKLLYGRLFKGTQNLFNRFLKKDDNENYVHVFQIINKLRMTCDHPQLALKDLDLDKNPLEKTLEQIDNFLQQTAGQRQLENHKKELIESVQNGQIEECGICSTINPQYYSISKCGHIYCSNCFEEAIQKQNRCPMCRTHLLLGDLIRVATGQEQTNEKFKQMSQATSSKLEAVLQETIKIKQRKEKCLIFTQWINMMHLVINKLETNDIYFLWIDGSMTTDKRARLIKDFSEMPHITALVLSLKATSTGLNLTMANHVFLVDPWWNPAIEDQAVGRAHRIGQAKTVHVKRFLCQDTIEQKIHQLHQRKRYQIHRALSNEQKKQQDVEDFKFLLLD